MTKRLNIETFSVGINIDFCLIQRYTLDRIFSYKYRYIHVEVIETFLNIFFYIHNTNSITVTSGGIIMKNINKNRALMQF